MTGAGHDGLVAAGAFAATGGAFRRRRSTPARTAPGEEPVKTCAQHHHISQQSQRKSAGRSRRPCKVPLESKRSLGPGKDGE